MKKMGKTYMDLTLKGNNMVYNMRVAILVKYGEHYLVQKAYDGEYFVLLGGRVKFKESIFHAAIREAKEEIGHDVDELKLVGVNESFFDLDGNGNVYHEHCFIFTAELAVGEEFCGDVEVLEMSPQALLDSKVYPRNLKRVIEGNQKFEYHIFNEIGEQINHDDLSFIIAEEQDEKLYETLNIRATGIIRDEAKVAFDIGGPFDGLVGGRIHQMETALDGMKREIEEELGVIHAEYKFRGIGEDFFTHEYGDMQITTHIIQFIFEVDILNTSISAADDVEIKYIDKSNLHYDRHKFASTIPFIKENTTYFASDIAKMVL